MGMVRKKPSLIYIRTTSTANTYTGSVVEIGSGIVALDAVGSKKPVKRKSFRRFARKSRNGRDSRSERESKRPAAGSRYVFFD